MCCHLVRERRSSKHPAPAIRVQGGTVPKIQPGEGKPNLSEGADDSQEVLQHTGSSDPWEESTQAQIPKLSLPALLFSPQGAPSAAAAQALGLPRGVWSPDVTGPKAQGMLQHQELLRAVSSVFKNEEIFFLQLCFQRSTWTEW